MSELVFNECVQLCTSVLSGFITWTFFTVKFKSVFSLSFCPAWRDGWSHAVRADCQRRHKSLRWPFTTTRICTSRWPQHIQRWAFQELLFLVHFLYMRCSICGQCISELVGAMSWIWAVEALLKLLRQWKRCIRQWFALFLHYLLYNLSLDMIQVDIYTVKNYHTFLVLLVRIKKENDTFSLGFGWQPSHIIKWTAIAEQSHQSSF